MSSLAQPTVVYPQAITTQNASASRGSFVPVFVVLAVIAVLAVVACLVGQVCARRYLRPRPRRDRAFYPKGDVEGQFETSHPTAKPAASVGGVTGEALREAAVGAGASDGAAPNPPGV